MIRHVVWHTLPTQSNGWGVNPGGPGNQTLSAVPYYDTLIGTSASTDLHALNDTHGKDFELGKALYLAGYAPIIVNVSRGSTYSNMWIPGGAYYATAIAEITNAWNLIKAAYPGDTFIHHHVVDQGEEDIRYPTSGIPSLWASNVAQSHAGLASTLGISTTALRIWVNRTHSTLNGALWPDIMHTQQLTAAGSPSHFLDRESYTWEIDGTHLTTSGYVRNGQELAALIIAGTPMGSLSPYGRNTLNNHFRNLATYTPAATHYAAAFVAGMEVTGNAYARASATNNTTTWPNAASRIKTNGAAFNFPAASGGDWGSVDEIRIFDASSGGNELGRHTLATPQNVTNGGSPLTIAVGAITITAAAGGLVDAVVHGLLNLMFGGTAYTQLTATFGSYWAGDPQGAGSQAGSRVSITQASTWNTSSAGITTTKADISLTDQGTGTYWAEHDASSAGNLLCSAILPATPSGGKVVAGTLRMVLT